MYISIYTIPFVWQASHFMVNGAAANLPQKGGKSYQNSPTTTVKIHCKTRPVRKYQHTSGHMKANFNSYCKESGRSLRSLVQLQRGLFVSLDVGGNPRKH